MKKYIYCALIALIALSCDKNEDFLMDTPLIIPETLSGQTPQLESRALREYLPESWDNSETVDSRTYAVEDEDSKSYTQYWSSGDAISLFYTTANLKYTLQSFKATDDEAIFELASSASNGKPLNTGYYYSVYPYKPETSINYESGVITYNFPNTQHYNGDSYANGENGMIAIEPKDTDGRYYFQNICSYLKLQMINVNESQNSTQPQKVKQIILTANNPDDIVAGDASIKFKFDGDIPVPVVKMEQTGSTNQITLDCGNGVELSNDSNNPTNFWFVLPGNFTFTRGFNIIVTFDDNTYFEKTTVEKEIYIARNHIKPMKPFATEEEEEEDIIFGPIRYKTSNNEPYPITANFYGENDQLLQIMNQAYDEETGEYIVYLSGELRAIGGNCFQYKGEGIPDIEYIKIQENTLEPIYIDGFAFFNCTAERIEISNNIHSIGGSAIKSSNIQEIIINGSVSEISADAFSGSTSLQTVTMQSVGIIRERAFNGCTNLANVSIPGVEHIKAQAFNNCSALTEIVLDNVYTIDDGAFFDCHSLTRVEISSNCTMIGEGAFCNATSLETVICHAVEPPFIKTDNSNREGSYVFTGTSTNLYIYVPNESIDDYKDPDYFIDYEWDGDENVRATVNWWHQQYYNKLVSIQ